MQIFSAIVAVVWLVGVALCFFGWNKMRREALAAAAKNEDKPNMLQFYIALLWCFGGVSVMMIAGSLLPIAFPL